MTSENLNSKQKLSRHGRILYLFKNNSWKLMQHSIQEMKQRCRPYYLSIRVRIGFRKKIRTTFFCSLFLSEGHYGCLFKHSAETKKMTETKNFVWSLSER